MIPRGVGPDSHSPHKIVKHLVVHNEALGARAVLPAGLEGAAQSGGQHLYWAREQAVVRVTHCVACGRAGMRRAAFGNAS